nr:MAG TPA: minor structural protein [Caudoviricetes sp.]
MTPEQAALDAQNSATAANKSDEAAAASARIAATEAEKAVTSRNAADTSRDQAQVSRDKADEARHGAEDARTASEKASAQSEVSRLASEAAKVLAEKSQQAVEKSEANVTALETKASLASEKAIEAALNAGKARDEAHQAQTNAEANEDKAVAAKDEATKQADEAKKAKEDALVAAKESQASATESLAKAKESALSAVDSKDFANQAELEAGKAKEQAEAAKTQATKAELEATKAEAKSNEATATLGSVKAQATLAETKAEEAKAKAEEALKKAGASTELADEAKNRALANIRDLNAFKTSVQEERENLSDELKRYSREETESRITSLRESFSNRFVAKSTYFENVEGINRRFEALTSDNEAKFAEYKQSVSERIANLSSQMADKANQVEFQRVKETAQLYERVLGNTEQGLPDKISRLVMTNEIFQTEVNDLVVSDNNLIVNSKKLDKHTIVNNRNGVSIYNTDYGVFNIDAQGLNNYNWGGFTLPIYVPKILKGEVYTLGFKYKIRRQLDHEFCVVIKNHAKNKTVLQKIVANAQTPELQGWIDFQGTFKMTEDLDFDQVGNFPIFFYLVKNGWVEVKEPMLVRGPRTGSFKPSQFDEAYRNVEATRTQVTQLAGSWSVKNLNSAGDVLGAINLNPDGSVKINEGLISVGEKTYIKDGVIKSSMIGNAQIGTAHIGEIDASKANIINISAKNIVTEGLTANIIKGGKLTSLNNVTDFDLQTGWLEMNGFGVGIKNQFPNRPLQYLVFGAGNINGVDGSYTALLSNRNGLQAMDNTSAGMQIWNGRTGYRIQSAINMYGQRITFNQSAQGGLREVAIDTGAHSISGLDEIVLKGVYLSKVLDDIYDNFRNLDHDGNYKRGYYSRWR